MKEPQVLCGNCLHELLKPIESSHTVIPEFFLALCQRQRWRPLGPGEKEEGEGGNYIVHILVYWPVPSVPVPLLLPPLLSPLPHRTKVISQVTKDLRAFFPFPAFSSFIKAVAEWNEREGGRVFFFKEISPITLHYSHMKAGLRAGHLGFAVLQCSLKSYFQATLAINITSTSGLGLLK